jgi:hypothetical protein
MSLYASPSPSEISSQLSDPSHSSSSFLPGHYLNLPEIEEAVNERGKAGLHIIEHYMVFCSMCSYLFHPVLVNDRCISWNLSVLGFFEDRSNHFNDFERTRMRSSVKDITSFPSPPHLSTCSGSLHAPMIW